jgi:hypothetical protein
MEELRAQLKDFKLATTAFKLAMEVFAACLEGFNASTSRWKLRTSCRKVPEPCRKVPEPVLKAVGKSWKPLGGGRNVARAAQKPIASKLERRGLKRKGATHLGRRDRGAPAGGVSHASEGRGRQIRRPPRSSAARRRPLHRSGGGRRRLVRGFARGTWSQPEPSGDYRMPEVAGNLWVSSLGRIFRLRYPP